MTVKICLIGGGGACISAIFQIQSAMKEKVEFVLISKTDTFHFEIASVRGVVDSSMAKDMFIPYTNLFNESKGRVIHGSPKSIDDKKVIMQDNSVIEFDFLVIGTGIKYPAPFRTSKLTKSEGIKEFEAIASDVKKSKHIVIVGGGPVGVEVCGEIMTDYSDKRVTLIHHGAQLIPGDFKPKFKNRVYQELLNRNVTVLLNTKAENMKDYIPNALEKGWATGQLKVKLSDGRLVDCDMIINATGNGKPNTEFVSLTNALDEREYVKVKSTLQLENFNHIFACGDCCNYDYYKLAVVAQPQGKQVGNNIVALINHKPLKAAKKYNPQFIAVSLGRTGGVLQLIFIWGNWVTAFLKSKTLFIDSTWKFLKVKK